MLAVLRRQCILDEVQRNGSALISGLAEQLSVSEMTIRRDLAGLEREGLLERVHGGAVLAQRGVEEPGFDKKVLCQQAEKAAIAGLAASMVKPGSAIGLSAGTTTCMLARQLSQVAGVTVVTNSMKVWTELQRAGDGRSHVILTGGDERTPSDALVGPTADATLRSMYVDVLFLGVHGMDPVAEAHYPERVRGGDQPDVHRPRPAAGRAGRSHEVAHGRTAHPRAAVGRRHHRHRRRHRRRGPAAAGGRGGRPADRAVPR